MIARMIVDPRDAVLLAGMQGERYLERLVRAALPELLALLEAAGGGTDPDQAGGLELRIEHPAGEVRASVRIVDPVRGLFVTVADGVPAN